MRIILFFCILFFIQSCHHDGYQAPKNALFTQLSPKECGIQFRNDIIDDSLFNEATYRNIYNGGGVAIGDINNDGLPDVFMAANQGKNKLFLNKGNFKFEDITDKSGIVKNQKWSTGVTMADVNADGLLDIYICASGTIIGETRKSVLFINKGGLVFEEEADNYDLADVGGTNTQAAFFDYDLDGDLDVFLVSNDCTVITTAYPYASVRTIRNKKSGDKLLRNDDGHFVDVTGSAGIYGAPFGFGLGIMTTDMNGDNWPDIYISNDFYEKDYVYINQQNGTFLELSDSYLSQMSNASMGGDIADINNDGLSDIFTTDMLPEDDYRLKKNTHFNDYDSHIKKYEKGYHHQITTNMLQLNNGDNTFSEISHYAGVSATDWSFGALIFDLDNDGWKDIVACNGMYLDVTDHDYTDFIGTQDMAYFLNRKALSKYQLIKNMSVSSPLVNYAFLNQGDLTFKNYSEELGLGEPGFSNGAAYADLDRDGDLDLVVNNINGECFVYRNNSTEKHRKNFLRVRLQGKGQNTFGVGASVTIYAGGVMQMLENYPTRGFQSSVEPVLTFGLDTIKRIDSLVVNWPDNKSQHLENIAVNSELLLTQADADAEFIINEKKGAALFNESTAKLIDGNINHKENIFVDFNVERLIPHMLSTEGPKMAVADLNGDGLDDFVVGGAKHDTTKVFLQTIDGTFRQCLPQIAFKLDEDYEDADLVFFDCDNDGDQDLLITSGGNLNRIGSRLLYPRLYLNNGKGTFERDNKRLPQISVNASCVEILDINGDGLSDIFIGGRSIPGQYGVIPKSYLLKNNNGVFYDATEELAPELQNIGMVTDAVWANLDNDSQMELVVVGEWMPITIFKNEYGKLTLPLNLNRQFSSTNGWWNCINAVDINNDGQLDLIAGNLGLNTKIKADSLHPVELYSSDFDNNGIPESILTYFKSDGKSYPYYLKDDIVAQLPMLKKKFLKHVDYAGKTIEEVFDKDQLELAVVKQAYQLQSCKFINKGDGKFLMQPLPTEAQLAPVYSILADDFDNDGWVDILLAGNFCGLKPEIGRYDANYGTFYKGEPNNELVYQSPRNSGFFYKGEARSLISISTATHKELIFLARNNDSLLVFEKTIESN